MALTSKLTAIADAVRAKTGKDAAMTLDQMAEEIASLGSGGDPLWDGAKDVNFRDYDGTLLYAYTAEEFMALDELPPNPSHDGLVAKGWNWTLAGAKEYVGIHDMNEIGQTYTTDDGSTRLVLEFEDGMDTTFGFFLYGAEVAGVSAIIDWGDGSQDTATFTKNELEQFSHSYESGGAYVVRVSRTDDTAGTLQLRSTNNAYPSVVAAGHLALREVFFGRGATVTIGTPFYGCRNLETVILPVDESFKFTSGPFSGTCRLRYVVIPGSIDSSINGFILNYSHIEGCSFPEGMTISGTGAMTMRECTKLQVVCIPDDVPMATQSMFSSCVSLRRVALPSNMTTLGSSPFNMCYSLEALQVPSSVTEMGSIATAYRGPFDIYVGSDDPPTLSSNGLGKLGVCPTIHVPKGRRDAYAAATNWSVYADKIVDDYVPKF